MKKERGNYSPSSVLRRVIGGMATVSQSLTDHIADDGRPCHDEGRDLGCGRLALPQRHEQHGDKGRDRQPELLLVSLRVQSILFIKPFSFSVLRPDGAYHDSNVSLDDVENLGRIWYNQVISDDHG